MAVLKLKPSRRAVSSRSHTRRWRQLVLYYAAARIGASVTGGVRASLHSHVRSPFVNTVRNRRVQTFQFPLDLKDCLQDEDLESVVTRTVFVTRIIRITK